MKRLVLAIATGGLLAGCNGAAESPAETPQSAAAAAQSPAAPESASAMQARTSEPAAAADLSGVYDEDGTGAICMKRQPDQSYVLAADRWFGVYPCNGEGTAVRTGDTLTIDFGDDYASCRFDARIDGTSIAFPEQLPEGCRNLCGAQAMFDGARYSRSADQSDTDVIISMDGRSICTFM
ncbi:hypothetical protein [Qipengyuania sp. JC766]|uniref:hypothetical protein n=1 Tax=Qipengyuania sp. JC766 TaxID=3232139 RepID=UPI003459FA46